MWEFNKSIFKKLMEKYGTEHIAKRVGASKVTVYNWSKGYATPSVKKLLEIANAFEIPPIAFFRQSNGREKQKVLTLGGDTYTVKLTEDGIEIKNVKTQVEVKVVF